MMQKELLAEIAQKLVTQKGNETYMDCLRKNLDIYMENKITLRKIAEEAGIPEDTLNTIKHGKTKDCKASTLLAIASALQVTVDELTGNIDGNLLKTFRTYEQLPERSKRLIDWHICDQKYKMEKHETQKFVSVMNAVCGGDGNLKRTHDYETYELSNMPNDISCKVFFGIKIPCTHYMPHFMQGDILLIANDRNALKDEITVVVIENSIFLTRRKIEKNGEVNYYGLRDNIFKSTSNSTVRVLGYVACVR